MQPITWLGIELKDWITIVALFLGPILAIQVQKLIEAKKEKRDRRFDIFKTLMATRAERLSTEHVQALNLIDIEFYGKIRWGTRFQTEREKAVTNAWKNYNDHLNHTQGGEDWWTRGEELLVKMLYEMSKSLGYDFDEVQLKRDAYRPMGHGQKENLQNEVLTGLAAALNNRGSLSVSASAQPASRAPQDATK